MRGKKSTLITTLAVIITVVSLVSCFGVLGISNSVQGVSIQEKKVWDVAIDNLSNLAMDEGAIEVIKEPTLDKIKLSYGLKLNSAPSVAQFEFTLRNKGNIDGIVSEIKITGLEQYANYLDVSLNGIKVGDTIKQGTFVEVKVLTNYKQQLVNEELVPQIINLDNIEIDIKLKKIE